MSYIVYKRCIHKQNRGMKSRYRCTEICNQELPCGHKCDYPCHMSDPMHTNHPCRQEHGPCQKMCPKNLHICHGEHNDEEPCPPCNAKVDKRLPCDHTIVTTCGTDGQKLRCNEPCGKTNGCTHVCQKKCGEDCGLCETLVQVMYGVCRHIYEVPCHYSTSLLLQPCTKMVYTKVQPKCGHLRLEPCHKAYKIDGGLKDTYVCKESCTEVMAGNGCGHKCTGNCSDCFQGRLHQRCERPCNKKYLYCAHWCMSTCSKTCSPCKQKCEAYCEHKRCPNLCCIPCDPCMENCSAGCQHSKCSKLCSEPCDREPCLFPCPKKLKCDHMCIGFCGEPCPNLCRICDKEEIEAGLVLEDELKDDHRFIYLESCGHTIENETMNKWMSALNTGVEIEIASCPVCRNPIYNLKRYSHDIVANFKEIKSIKIKQVGDNENNRERTKDLIVEIIRVGMPPFSPPLTFIHFQEFLIRQLIDADDFIIEAELKFMRMIVTMFERAEEVMEEFRNLGLNRVMLQDLENLHWKLFTMVQSRPLPFQPLEVQNLNREIARINSAANLFKRVTVEKNTQLLLHASGHYPPRDIFIEAYKILLNGIYFRDEDENYVASAIVDIDQKLYYEIGIDDSERHDIITSFKSFIGRWCKCPNGHIYVITECGGAMEIGKCNECGELIGGGDHSLLQMNTFAPEMEIPFKNN